METNKPHIELESLVGLHMLTGVDFETSRINTWGNEYEPCQVLNFTLDGKTYTAIEDPSDGYRSTLDRLLETDTPTKNVFAPVQVMAKMKDTSEYGQVDDTLILVDVKTGKLVLEVGTGNSDDYYPSFVANFIPENMACNQKGKA